MKAYKDDRTAKVEEYMSDLMAVKYSGIQEIYDEYYAWHVSIVANTSEDDNSSDVSTVSRKDTVYFHATLSGGEPSEQIMLYYEVTWPGGQSQIFDKSSYRLVTEYYCVLTDYTKVWLQTFCEQG